MLKTPVTAPVTWDPTASGPTTPASGPSFEERTRWEGPRRGVAGGRGSGPVPWLLSCAEPVLGREESTRPLISRARLGKFLDLLRSYVGTQLHKDRHGGFRVSEFGESRVGWLGQVLVSQTLLGMAGSKSFIKESCGKPQEDHPKLPQPAGNVWKTQLGGQLLAGCVRPSDWDPLPSPLLAWLSCLALVPAPPLPL